MERALGIGGFFLRSRDPVALARWYREHLGIETFTPDGAGAPWLQEAGPTAFSTFPTDTDYFGGDQTRMLNFRVSSLDAMLRQLRDAGVKVDDRMKTMDGIGRFGWATDSDGNRFELWEPAVTDG